MIWTEERSQSTHGNALFSAEILRNHRINTAILVVDASSMPRGSQLSKGRHQRGTSAISVSDAWDITRRTAPKLAGDP
jgi:hypothetical protein